MKRFRDILPFVALAFALLGGLWLHQWNIGTVPLGIFNDEASIGLNASMIERFQTDEFGRPWPLFFEAFGEYKNPLYIYGVSALLHVLPLSDVSLRGVSFLFFGITLTLWSLLALRVFRSPWTAVFTTAALAISPWLFTLSRVAFEAVSYVSIYVALLICIYLFFEKRRGGIAGGVVTGLLAGLAWYSYSTARLLIPLSILALFIAYLRRARRRSWFALALGLTAALIPALWLLATDPEVLLGRFSTLSYLYDPALSSWDKAGQFFGHYLGYFSPDFHLLNGDGNLRHHTGYGGMSYYGLYITMIAGVLLTLFRFRKASPFSVFMLLELFFAPLAASLTEGGHTIRVITMIIPIVYFSGINVDWLCLRVVNVTKHRLTLAATLFLFTVSLVAESRMFITQAMTVYPHISVRHFMTFGVQEAVQKVGQDNKTLLVVDPQLPEAEVISNYYSLVTDNGVYVTSLPESLSGSITVPYCYLKKKKHYDPAHTGEHSLPLDVRSSLSLTCHP